MFARLLFCPLLTLLMLLVVGSSRPVAASAPIALPASPDWDPACYSNYAQIDTFLHNQASQYPQIATLLDGGLAWEGTRHIWALKLTSSIHPEPKPGLFLIAGQHPRDIATTEMLLRLITYLTQSYGIDPDVTWLLDNRTLIIIPSANPDGYAQVPLGLNQYKNRDNNYCPNTINRGADINRNYPFQWNTVGTSPLTCDLSYPGPSALSEPESRAILSLFQANSPDLLINLQATGPSILYPWGYTPTPPPDAPGLFALGWNFGRLNGTPPSEVRTENSHLPISGIIDDTAYGMGMPANTFNVGSTQNPRCTDL
jgi:carboxypeptidase T